MDQPTGEVEISRPAGHFRDRVRRYRIEINGMKSATIGHGETVTVHTAEGVHVVQARIDWTGSPKINVNVTSDRAVKLIVRPAGGAWGALFQLFGRTRYLILEVT